MPPRAWQPGTGDASKALRVLKKAWCDFQLFGVPVHCYLTLVCSQHLNHGLAVYRGADHRLLSPDEGSVIAFFDRRSHSQGALSLCKECIRGVHGHGTWSRPLSKHAHTKTWEYEWQARTWPREWCDFRFLGSFLNLHVRRLYAFHGKFFHVMDTLNSVLVW